MKKIICTLFAILMLSACNAEAEITPGENISSPAGENSVSEENDMPEAKPMSVDEQRLRERAGLTFEIFGWDKVFEGYGIYVDFDNIEFAEDWYFSAEIVLKKGENELRIPFEGIYDYSEEHDMTSADFGSFNFIGNESAVFCGKERAVFFDIETLENWDIEIEFPEREADDIWVNSADYDGKKEQFVIIATDLDYRETERGATFVSVHDKEGKCVSVKETGFSGSSEFAGNYFPSVFISAEIFELEGEEFISNGYSFESLESDRKYYCELQKETGYDDYSLRIYCYYENNYSNDDLVAFLYKNGDIIGQLAFYETDFSSFYEEYDMPILVVFSEGKKAKYYSDYFAMTLELDFENGTHTLSYNPTDRHTGWEENYEEQGKKYSVCTFGETFGGDAYACHYAIRNNKTGKYVYIGESGGMWGGYGDMGFLKNGDFYTYSTRSLKIIDPETGKIKFDITENFPLGYDEKTDSERGLLTFRRDPENFTYIIVYYEYENGSESTEVENEFGGWHYEWDFNYKIGFLDAEGNLLESYDTGMPFFSNFFGINAVTMFYTPEELTITVRGGRSISGFIGVFDLATHEFKAVPLEE